jgi:hypothetical protein
MHLSVFFLNVEFDLKKNFFHRYCIDIEGALRQGLLNKRLMLSLSFRCDQIYMYKIYDFGHTLLCYLSPTWMFNKPTSGYEENSQETNVIKLFTVVSYNF